MGFHVCCSGADVLQELNEDATRFLGEPFALYLVALATEIDDKAVEWLHKYERTLDSLCGPYAGFLLFYNEAKLIAEPYPRHQRNFFRWGELTWHETEPEEDKDNTPLELDVSAATLRGGFAAVDSRFRFDERAFTDKDILLRSLTYESDEVARELNIVGRLPCILIVDDPASVDFYLFSLKDADESTLRDLRELFSAFIKDSKHKRYLDTLREWRSANDKLQALEHDLAAPARNSPAKETYIINQIRTAEQLLLNSMPKSFRTAINKMESQSGNVGTLDWKAIRKKSSHVGKMLSVKQKLNSPSLTDAQRENLISKARDLLGHQNELPATEWSNQLQRSSEHTAAKISESIAEQLGIRRKQYAKQAEGIRKALDKYKATAATCELELQLLERPRIGPHIRSLQRKKRNAVVWNYVQSATGTAASKAPTFLDAIKKAVDLLSPS
uniref:Uncharacterized protein n=1 Tax=Candidatus Kentrum sp. DK TaxID=2126562 RepID=A0A450T904_9GAMM|nr:MAG: hypothetical protein BECKDK2373C_GA0170839_11048 [Candidatus Kentron sp. DK]